MAGTGKAMFRPRPSISQYPEFFCKCVVGMWRGTGQQYKQDVERRLHDCWRIGCFETTREAGVEDGGEEEEGLEGTRRTQGVDRFHEENDWI